MVWCHVPAMTNKRITQKHNLLLSIVSCTVNGALNKEKDRSFLNVVRSTERFVWTVSSGTEHVLFTLIFFTYSKNLSNTEETLLIVLLRMSQNEPIHSLFYMHE